MPRRAASPRVAERPFDSVRKRMSTDHAAFDRTVFADLPDGRPVAFVKGAIDGPAVCYCRDEEQIDWLKEHLGGL